MTMIARVDDHSQNLLHKSNLMQTETVWQKMQKGTALQKDSEDTVIGKAAEVFISKEGRKLCEDAQDPLKKLTQTDFMTEGERKLNELLGQKAEREELNKQANELEERLNSDTSLTDKEKEDMQAEIDDLREKGKSPDDKLHEMYQKKFALEDEQMAGHPEYLQAEQQAWQLDIQKQLLQADVNIRNAKNEIHAEGMWQEVYTQQILQERGDLAVAKNRADYLNSEIDFRSSELSMSVRTDEQVQAQAEENGKRRPTAADVVQAAVEEGKARAENADDATGKLADGIRDSALSQQEKLTAQSSTISMDSEETAKLLNHAEEMEKITLGDAMTK